MAQDKPSIEVLSDRSHLLLRPNMYLGGVDQTDLQDFIIKNDNINYESYTIVPALLKIINEVIDNSIDAAIRADFKCGTNISVKIDDSCVIVKDDGSGIPSQKVNGKYPAELCWGYARAGSNFQDDNRVTIGAHGIGAFATNVFSTKFIGVSDDGTGCVKFISKNNAESYEVKPQESKSRGTCVTFYPDLGRFKVSEIDETHKNAIYQRLINLSVCYPQINFKFNGKAIKISNFKKLAELFSKDSIVYENSGISIAIAPNATDDFKQYSYVNGLKISDGGTHIDTIMGQVVTQMREKLQRKYKSIKPGDIKNKLTCIVFMRGFPNAKFNSQSKEKITNSIKEFNDFAKIDYSFVNKILKSDAIVNPIIDIYKIKEEYENRKALKSVETKKKLKSEKYFRATGTPKYLCICEGFSAYGGLSVVLGNKEVEYYVLKGKLKSVYKINNTKEMFDNREVKELFNIISSGVETQDMPEGDFFIFSIEGENFIVNENDLIKYKGNWICVKKLLEENLMI